MLKALDIARNSLIEEILSIDNISTLKNLKDIIEANQLNKQVKISKQQLEILKMSDIDIKERKLTENSIAYKKDLEWLNQQ